MDGLDVSFSILERIVGVETPLWDKAQVLWTWITFSILERIVGVETDPFPLNRGALYNFQYPRTDRWG